MEHDRVYCFVHVQLGNICGLCGDTAQWSTQTPYNFSPAAVHGVSLPSVNEPRPSRKCEKERTAIVQISDRVWTYRRIATYMCIYWFWLKSSTMVFIQAFIEIFYCGFAEMERVVANISEWLCQRVVCGEDTGRAYKIHDRRRMKVENGVNCTTCFRYDDVDHFPIPSF